MTSPRRVPIAPAAVVALLRAVVGSPPFAPLPDEHAATMGRPLPDAMTIDAGAWVAWCLAGLHVCERFGLEDEPDGAASWIETIGEIAKRLVTMLAMRRAGGSIPHAARDLRATRRALAASLRAVGLRPWPRSPDPTPRPRLDAVGLPRLAPAVLGTCPLALVGSDEHAPAAVSGPGALAVVQALAAILERAEALRADRYDPRAAIERAMREHRTGRDLEGVARAAWALAVGSDDATTRGGS